MNKTLFTILVSGASALAGGVAGYILCRKLTYDKIERELNDKFNEELSRIRQANIERNKKAEAEETPVVEEPNYEEQARDFIYALMGDEAEAEGVIINADRVRDVSRVISMAVKDGCDSREISARVEEYIAGYEHPEEDLPEGVDEYEHLSDEELPQAQWDEWQEKGPYVIPLAEYTALPTIFEFLTFQYFEEDDVLIDDGDMIVDDVEGTVGDALHHFGDEAAEWNDCDDDTVYVVNGRMGLAIEIVRIHNSYQEWAGIK